MVPCRFCGATVPAERAEIYSHCTRHECVAAWRRERIADASLALVLSPKQGLMWTTTAEVGSSSGRASGK